MLRQLQACVMLLLTVIWMSSSGVSLAYCQRTGAVHSASGDCCCAPVLVSDCDDCCSGESHEEEHGHECCGEDSRGLPDAVAPSIGVVAPPLPVAVVPDYVVFAGQPGGMPLEASSLDPRAPPPPSGGRYLVLRSLRL